MALSLYPRTIDVHRPKTNAVDGSGNPQKGLVAYSGATQGTGGEAVIMTGIPCSIQARSVGKVEARGVTPADAPGPVQWHIYIPARSAAKGSIHDRDIIVDDESMRYQVAGAYWNILGFRLLTIRLET